MNHVHFIGIGGAGMSGLAEILLARGIRVSGSDHTASVKTTELEKLGATIFIGEDASNLSGDVDLVVFTSAIDRAENVEFNEAKNRGLRLLRRAEFLGELTHDLKTIAVAGTHGKTTTTAMIAAVLIEAKLDPTVVVGGSIHELGGKNARRGKGQLAVVEADEYDRSFLALTPYIAVLTSLEAEHLDIYKDLEDLRSAFTEFANRSDSHGAQSAMHGSQGFAIVCLDEQHVRELTPRLEKRIVTYSTRAPEAKYRATDIVMTATRTRAVLWRGAEIMGLLELNVPGEHNVRNALAAIAVGEVLAIPFEITKRALKKFVGAERRFQIKGEPNGILVIDDYAHHPTEIRATLATVRSAYPGRRIVACFQPHTFTRTRDFAGEFGAAFAEFADHLLLLEIYPSRESPIEGVTSQLILDAAASLGLSQAELVAGLDALPEKVSEIAKPGDIVLTMGAGSITEASGPIVDILGLWTNSSPTGGTNGSASHVRRLPEGNIPRPEINV